MKNILRSLSFIFLFSIVSIGSFAQDTFEGTIKYKISFEGRELSAQEKAQMPSEQIIYYKGPLIKTDNITAMGGVSTIVDSETKTNIILYDMMGQKMAFKGQDTSSTEEKQLTPKVTALEESKTILGYKCKKYELVFEEGFTIEAYITEEIDAKDPVLSNVKDIKGFMLEFTQTSKEDEDIIVNYTVTEVSKAKVKKTIFNIPAGYEVKTMEDLKNMMGGE